MVKTNEMNYYAVSSFEDTSQNANKHGNITMMMIADLYSPPNIHGNRMLMTKIEENNCHTVMNSLPPENHARGKVEWGVGGGFRTVMNLSLIHISEPTRR